MNNIYYIEKEISAYADINIKVYVGVVHVCVHMCVYIHTTSIS